MARKMTKSATPWAVAGAAITGVIAAFAVRSVRGKAKRVAVESKENVPSHEQSDAVDELGTIPHASGAV